jgi:hypothetical protein
VVGGSNPPIPTIKLASVETTSPAFMLAIFVFIKYLAMIF